MNVVADCLFWCQTGKGFPSLAAPKRNQYLQGMRWRCPCGRSWRVKGDGWQQEGRLTSWVLDRYWWVFYPEWAQPLRTLVYRLRITVPFG